MIKAGSRHDRKITFEDKSLLDICADYFVTVSMIESILNDQQLYKTVKDVILSVETHLYIEAS